MGAGTSSNKKIRQTKTSTRTNQIRYQDFLETFEMPRQTSVPIVPWDPDNHHYPEEEFFLGYLFDETCSLQCFPIEVITLILSSINFNLANRPKIDLFFPIIFFDLKLVLGKTEANEEFHDKMTQIHEKLDEKFEYEVRNTNEIYYGTRYGTFNVLHLYFKKKFEKYIFYKIICTQFGNSVDSLPSNWVKNGITKNCSPKLIFDQLKIPYFESNSGLVVPVYSRGISIEWRFDKDIRANVKEI